jgi:hypothetical protein
MGATLVSGEEPRLLVLELLLREHSGGPELAELPELLEAVEWWRRR